jgi:hypothetical protein
MNSSQEKPYGYSHLFAILFSFSALASGIFTTYLLFRADSLLFLESPLVAFVLLIAFSGMSEKISKVRNIGLWVFSISLVTMIISHSIVDSSIVYLGGDWQAYCLAIFAFTAIGFLFGPMAWQMSEGSYHYIRTKGVGRRTLLTIVICSFAAIVVYATMTYISQVTSFLDTHTWIVSLVVPFVVFFVGVVYGRRTKKNQI